MEKEVIIKEYIKQGSIGNVAKTLGINTAKNNQNTARNV